MTEKIEFFCFDLSILPRNALFIVLTIITFGFFLIFGYMQELMFKLDGFDKYSWFLTLMQFFLYSCFGFGELTIRKEASRKIPLRKYLLLSFLTVATIGLSNTSVAYLNFPTQVMFKSCKLIPVLIGGILIQGKKFNIYDVCACIMMSLGLIFFTLADVKVQPSFQLYGVVLILGALCADAAIGNVQEKEMKSHKASSVEVVFYSYTIGFFYILAGQIAFGDFNGAVHFCMEHPKKTFGYAFIFSLTGYAGLNIVLHLVRHFGALIAVTVTNCRKAVTIVLSFMFFTKPFTLQYLWSGLLVFAGIYLNLMSKDKEKWDNLFRTYYVRLMTINQKKHNNRDHADV